MITRFAKKSINLFLTAIGTPPEKKQIIAGHLYSIKFRLEKVLSSLFISKKFNAINDIRGNHHITSNYNSFVKFQKKNFDVQLDVKVIAYYLPQFHAIPENNSWWGEGFTEWTNVKPAQPQFEGHYQPRIPIDMGYYNLLDSGVQQRQVELARNYGIGGFCFHYYWFDGKRLLEKPIENYLLNKNLQLPFCLSWANENWSRRWDGQENDVLIQQNHTPEDDIRFIEYTSKYFEDSRYIRINDKPLFIIYRPGLLPSAKETIERWRTWYRQQGRGELYIACTHSFDKTDPRDYGMDAALEFPPNNSNAAFSAEKVQPTQDKFKCNLYDWDSLVANCFPYYKPEYKIFRGVCPSWDNTARRKNNSTIFIGNTPEKYQKWLELAIKDTLERFPDKDERLIFVNAWNEWAEGAYLEPDAKNGYAYLEATWRAQKKLNFDAVKAV